MNKKILIVSPRFPYPPYKGDQLVVFNCLKYLSENYDVDLITFGDEIDVNDKKTVKQFCSNLIIVKPSKFEILTEVIKSFFFSIPLQVAFFKSRKFEQEIKYLFENTQYDLILPFTLRMSQYVENQPSKKYIHLIDSMYLNMKRRYENEHGIKKIIFKYEAKIVNRYEQNLINKYDKLFVVSQIDKEIIAMDNSKLEVFPNGVNIYECKEHKNSTKKVLNLIFTGNMGYFPNENAVIWFIENCWDIILKEIPYINFNIVGKNPSKKLKDIVVKYKNIRLIGFVESIEEEICKADIAIAPMQSGSGMQNKILEAMATKTPVITSTLGLGDIRAINKKDILVANTPQEYLDSIIYLINKDHRTMISEAGYKYVQNNHIWSKIIKEKIILGT